jgi:hypothetical protein
MGSTRPLTEMSTKNLSGGKRRPARKTDNLLSSWACYRDSFPFFIYTETILFHHILALFLLELQRFTYEFCLLRYNDAEPGDSQQTFRSSISPPYSGLRSKIGNQHNTACWFLSRLTLDFQQTARWYIQVDTNPHGHRYESLTFNDDSQKSSTLLKA